MVSIAHIVVVDDDTEITSLIAEFLERHDFRVSCFVDGQQLQRFMQTQHADLFILDKCLTGEDGVALGRLIRQGSDTPIIMLTGVQEDIEHILALESGIDDYMTKPFNSRVLLAKIRALLRIAPKDDSHNSAILHREKITTEQTIYCFEQWQLNITTHTLHNPEQALVALSSAERELLHVFLLNQGIVLSRNQILDLSNRDDFPYDRSVDVLVSRLRKKIMRNTENDVIKTIRNVGYVFLPSVEKRVISNG